MRQSVGCETLFFEEVQCFQYFTAESILFWYGGGGSEKRAEKVVHPQKYTLLDTLILSKTGILDKRKGCWSIKNHGGDTEGCL